MIKLNQNGNLTAIALLQLLSLIVFPGYAHATYDPRTLYHSNAPYGTMQQNDYGQRFPQQTFVQNPSYQSLYEYYLGDEQRPEEQNRTFYPGQVPGMAFGQPPQRRIYTTSVPSPQFDDETEKELSVLRHQQLKMIALIEQGYLNLDRNEYLFVQIQKIRQISMFNAVYPLQVYLQKMFRMYDIMESRSKQGVYIRQMTLIQDLETKVIELLNEIVRQYVVLGFDQPKYNELRGMITNAKLGSTILCDSLKNVEIVNKMLKSFNDVNIAADKSTLEALRTNASCNEKLTAAMKYTKQKNEEEVANLRDEIDSDAFMRAVKRASDSIGPNRGTKVMHTMASLVKNIGEFVNYTNNTGVRLVNLNKDIEHMQQTAAGAVQAGATATSQSNRSVRPQVAPTQTQSKIVHSKPIGAMKAMVGAYNNMFISDSPTASTKQGSSAPVKPRVQRAEDDFEQMFADTTNWKDLLPKYDEQSGVLEPEFQPRPVQQTYPTAEEEFRATYAPYNDRLEQLREEVNGQRRANNLTTDSYNEQRYDRRY
ncbi:hypothetical protein VCUG_02104 [Vavraia culicis subsp. floridensis]|uniref:Uncharacterized protein n=1 Tax=Vavraia culicis (isolate floridensis) TaxID=948595 RepID=L2GRZ9_VAVCU|nr:uncharacterized protein VCUG_02104 [Vavraia culicis subsp. floridensis]ELA46426.1 hypothetical protein VCUG_02104 [Vavraia culicis subsp. floridensis]